MRTKHSTRRTIATALGCVAAAMLLWGMGTPITSACSTPVYRYAMYNWPPTPYYVFYFHHGETPAEDKAVNKLLEKLPDAKLMTNVMLQTVDVTDEDQMKYIPGVVQESYKKQADGDKPMHLVYSPHGTELFAGRLDVKAVRAMIGSPARKQIGKLLHEGNVGAFIILEGPDAKKNELAHKVMDEVIKMAAAGKIVTDLAGGMPDQFLPEKEGRQEKDAKQDDDAKKESPFALKIAKLKVSRDDPAEQWLVRQLMAVEEDLAEFPKETMIFAVYGRGRAMPPYLDKGINANNLAGEVMFLASSCSCQVKDQNPGMDLVMRWDWDATAEALAADDPAYAEEMMGYEEFELPEPTDNPTKDATDEPKDEPAEEPKAEQPAKESPDYVPSDPASADRSSLDSSPR